MLPFVDLLANPWRTLVYALCFLAGVALLEQGADWFTDASAALAKRLRAPQTLVGLLTAGGEWEELVVVVAAVVSGHGGIALGDVLGSTIANVLGAFPLGLLARQPLQIERSARVYALGMLAVTLLVSALLFAGPITRTAGGALVALFLVYIASILLAIRRGMLAAPAEQEDDEAEEREEIVQVVFIILGLALISLGAWLVVEPAVYFAHALDLPETIIGLTIVAIGTTLPDKAISLAGGLKQQGGLVVANAVGGNIFLLTLTLGLAALASPIAADAQTLRFDVPVMIGCAFLLWLLLLRQRLHWRVGVLLLLLYGGYLAYQFVGK